MSDDDNDNVVDLAAFREQKLREEEEKARLEKEEKDLEEIESMRYLLSNIMQQLGDPSKTGTLFYVPLPLTDDDYNSYYSLESGYNDEGYYESTWEWKGFEDEEDYFYEPEEED